MLKLQGSLLKYFILQSSVCLLDIYVGYKKRKTLNTELISANFLKVYGRNVKQGVQLMGNRWQFRMKLTAFLAYFLWHCPQTLSSSCSNFVT